MNWRFQGSMPEDAHSMRLPGQRVRGFHRSGIAPGCRVPAMRHPLTARRGMSLTVRCRCGAACRQAKESALCGHSRLSTRHAHRAQRLQPSRASRALRQGCAHLSHDGIGADRYVLPGSIPEMPGGMEGAMKRTTKLEKPSRLRRSVLSGAIAACAGAAWAQEPAQLGTIEIVAPADHGYVVRSVSRATRTDTPVENLPHSIITVPRSIIEDQGSRSPCGDTGRWCCHAGQFSESGKPGPSSPLPAGLRGIVRAVIGFAGGWVKTVVPRAATQSMACRTL